MRITVNILLGIKEEIDTAAWQIIRDDGYWKSEDQLSVKPESSD